MLLRMIGRLKGIICDKTAEGITLDNNGVGFEISLPLSTLASLPPTGQEAELWIHTHVREDEIRLFGFSVPDERHLFRTLIGKVSGVGPKVALAVIGAMDSATLARAINEGDTRRLCAIPGIGKKTAERIVLELAGRVVATGSAASAPVMGVFSELDSALKNLGFKASEVERVIGEVRRAQPADASFEVLLREALSVLRAK